MRQVHSEGVREQQNMKQAAEFRDKGKHKLVAYRKHPNLDDRTIKEVWGRYETREVAEEARQERLDAPEQTIEFDELKIE